MKNLASALRCRLRYVLSRSTMMPRAQGQIPPASPFGPALSPDHWGVCRMFEEDIQEYVHFHAKAFGIEFIPVTSHYWDEGHLNDMCRVLDAVCADSPSGLLSARREDVSRFVRLTSTGFVRSLYVDQ